MKMELLLVAGKANVIRRASHALATTAFVLLACGPANAEVSQTPLYLGGGNVPGNLTLVRLGIAIGIVGVKHHSVVDAEREVRRAPAARGERNLDRLEAARSVDPRPPGRLGIVALAGQHHVVVAVEA